MNDARPPHQPDARLASGSSDPDHTQRLILGIVCRIASTICFAGVGAFVKIISPRIAIGEITFSRAFFALIPVLIWAAWERQLPGAFVTRQPMGHAVRSMLGLLSTYFGFSALSLLPLADATAIGYASPLMMVILAAIVLGERVRIHRWSAVVVGLAGVLIILSDYVLPGSTWGEYALIGALFQLLSGLCWAMAAIQIRRLHETERSATIVIYFSLFAAAASLVTLPFGWQVPNSSDAFYLLCIGIAGGIGQVFITQALRFSDVSALAPFEYLSLVWAVTIGMTVFGDVPTPAMLVGAVIVVGAGAYVIYRERKLGIPRASVPPPPRSLG